jgi:hypothetical protein
LDDGSKGGEVFLVDDLLALPSLVLVLVLLPLLRPLLALPEEAQSLQVLVEAHSAGSELHHVLTVALADLLVLLLLQHSQLLLLYPLRIHVLLGRSLLLVSGVDLHALTLVVLLQGRGLGLFRLLLSGGLLDWSLALDGLLGFSGRFLWSILDVLVAVELVLDVADVAPSSALLSRLIADLRVNYTRPVPLLRSW